jgi:hypothetical protein
MSKVTLNGTNGISGYDSDGTTLFTTKSLATLNSNNSTVFPSPSILKIERGLHVDAQLNPPELRYVTGDSTLLDPLLDLIISSNTLNYSVSVAAVNAGWSASNPIPIKVTINPGIYVYASSYNKPAIDITSSLNLVTIVNSGYILGGGGDGATATSTGGQNGSNGIRSALAANKLFVINNADAFICGGGGGGGSSAAGGGGGAGGGLGGSGWNGTGGSGGSPGNAGSDGIGSFRGGGGGAGGGGGGLYDYGGGSYYGGGGGGGGRRPTNATGGAEGGGGYIGRAGGANGSASAPSRTAETNGGGGGGGGFGANGSAGYGAGGFGGAAINSTNAYTLTNNGTIWGAS